MSDRPRGWLWEALAWLALPMAPVVLEGLHHDTVNWSNGPYGGPDPSDWDGFLWLTAPGPLLGYGFLAGATLDLFDDPSARGSRTWLSRRAVWVSLGPWVGLIAGLLLFFLLMSVRWGVPLALAPLVGDISLGQWWAQKVGEPVRQGTGLVMAALAVAALCYAWFVPAVAVLRRARGQGRLKAALQRGLAMMIAFVGSLFGGFWAVVQIWRSYFFDTTIVPLLLIALSLVTLSGCASTITYGEVRRRELFHAMLLSWVLGLALVWRWWSRPRGKG